MSYPVRVFDDDWDLIAYLDQYESLIWTDKRLEPGDFELVIEWSPELWSTVRRGSYLRIDDSAQTMRVEKRVLDDSYEGPPQITFSGRTMLAAFDQRIVNEKRVWNDVLPGDCLNYALDTYFFGGAADRSLGSKFWRTASQWKPQVGDTTSSFQYEGESCLEVLDDILSTHGRTTCFARMDHEQDNRWHFWLGTGVDRSWGQSANDWVTFSPSFGNLSSSKYTEDYSNDRTHLYVAGQEGEEGIPKEVVLVSKRGGPYTGLDRYEQWIESNLQRRDADNKPIQRPGYRTQLSNYGLKSLGAYSTKTSFEGSVDPTVQWAYSVDYSIGDVVNVADELGNSQRCVIDSCVITADGDGLSIVPAFIKA